MTSAYTSYLHSRIPQAQKRNGNQQRNPEFERYPPIDRKERDTKRRLYPSQQRRCSYHYGSKWIWQNYPAECRSRGTYRSPSKRYVRDRILETGERILDKLQNGIVDSKISTAAGLERGSPATYGALPYSESPSHMPRYLSQNSGNLRKLKRLLIFIRGYVCKNQISKIGIFHIRS